MKFTEGTPGGAPVAANKKTPETWADASGGNASPNKMGMVEVFQTLDELRALGPLWVREQLKRRVAPREKGQQVRTFGEGPDHAAVSEEEGL